MISAKNRYKVAKRDLGLWGQDKGSPGAHRAMTEESLKLHWQPFSESQESRHGIKSPGNSRGAGKVAVAHEDAAGEEVVRGGRGIR